MNKEEFILALGIKSISGLDESTWGAVVASFSALQPGQGMEEVVELLPNELEEEERWGLVLLSFRISNSDEMENILEVSKDIVSNYFEDEPMTEEEFSLFSERLQHLQPSLWPLQITLKGIDLALEGSWTYLSSRIVSDIRLIFNESLNDNKRNGIINHVVRITVQKGDKTKDLTFTCDLKELQMLKDQIDRAMKKHTLIQNDYSKSIHFIN